MFKLEQPKVEKEYYSDNSRVNNSFIGWFLQSPWYAYQRLNNLIVEPSTKSMDMGSAIHMWLLQPEIFWDNYKILDFVVPKSANKKKFADLYKDIPFITDRILISLYRQCYSTEKLTDEAVLKLSKELVVEVDDYVNSLIKADTRACISGYEHYTLKTIQENVKKHKKANQLLFEPYTTESIASEFHINFDYDLDGKRIPAKALIDRIVVDPTNKVVKLVDIKNTESNSTFENSIAKFDYYRQLAWYWHAIDAYFESVGLDISDFKRETYFITIQWKDQYVRVFSVDWSTLQQKQTELKQILNQIYWHLDNDLWEHSQEYYLGDGSEKLKT